MKGTKEYLKIKNWAEEDRPREKLLLKSKSALSDAELIGILIGSGTSSMSAVDVAKSILNHTGNDLNNLAKLSVKELMKFKGIGEAKAISIVSAMELGRRRKETQSTKKPKITCSEDAYEAIKPELMDMKHEEFWTLLLSRSNTIIKKQLISSGGVAGTVADPKIIFKSALEELACTIILVHNHPSGNLRPSQADINLTKKMKAAGDLLEIPVLDHLIFTDNGYFSFADENML
ncbi:DNA repair protein RadC [Fulvivirga kasyanovii]|uniref:JAB domain-containing protein n=1 Tax=Fulvivirga kasyanovii TaxID=396812 RepID=A0ABW9RJ83_9BACT|nr:DNA repair protein RadC [Fulvivirga kasyanovii]MTI23449.1 JAB domain-containing protein [Fulvivirga kasyanovii]